MKKILAMVILCVFLGGCFLFCGCEKLDYNNFPDSMQEPFRQLIEKADTALRESNINDVEAFDRETSLVAYTLDRNVPFEVTFLYQDHSTEAVAALPAISCRATLVDEFRYREMFKANLTLKILSVLEESKISDDGDIVGMIVHWEREYLFGKKYYSVCDFDGDGAWDYRVRDVGEYDSMYYTNLTPTSTPDTHDPVRVFDEHNIIGLSAGIPRFNKLMYTLTGLSGNETFRDLEKLFKADAKPA